MEIPTRSPPLDTGAYMFRTALVGTSYVLTTCDYKFQGSRPRCLCRFICCTFFIALFLVASVILSLALVRLFAVPRTFLLIPMHSGYDHQISSLEVTMAQ